MIPIKQQVQEAAAVVREAWFASGVETEELPQVIITTGSGLGALAHLLAAPAFEISYSEIPHLPASGMPGHAGRLLIGRLGNSGTRVVMLDGRVHGYEGNPPLTQVLPLLIAHELCEGARLALLTNAAGAINESYHVGELMLISDHINFTGNTVVSLNEEANFGGHNMDMTFVYSPEHRRTLAALAREREIKLYQGVYIGVKGAMFETPAEIVAFRRLGADAVGMSTVHEATAASRLGMEVVGLSVLTNMAAGIETKRLTHEEVLEVTTQASENLCALVDSFLSV